MNIGEASNLSTLLRWITGSVENGHPVPSTSQALTAAMFLASQAPKGMHPDVLAAKWPGPDEPVALRAEMTRIAGSVGHVLAERNAAMVDREVLQGQVDRWVNGTDADVTMTAIRDHLAQPRPVPEPLVPTWPIEDLAAVKDDALATIALILGEPAFTRGLEDWQMRALGHTVQAALVLADQVAALKDEAARQTEACAESESAHRATAADWVQATELMKAALLHGTKDPVASLHELADWLHSGDMIGAGEAERAKAELDRFQLELAEMKAFTARAREVVGDFNASHTTPFDAMRLIEDAAARMSARAGGDRDGTCGLCRAAPLGNHDQFCDGCVDRCHESTDFAHRCVICDGKDTARG